MFGGQPEVLPAPSQVYGPTRPDLLKQPLEYEQRLEPGFSSLVAEVRRAATMHFPLRKWNFSLKASNNHRDNPDDKFCKRRKRRQKLL